MKFYIKCKKIHHVPPTVVCGIVDIASMIVRPQDVVEYDGRSQRLSDYLYSYEIPDEGLKPGYYGAAFIFKTEDGRVSETVSDFDKID